MAPGIAGTVYNQYPFAPCALTFASLPETSCPLNDNVIVNKYTPDEVCIPLNTITCFRIIYILMPAIWDQKKIRVETF